MGVGVLHLAGGVLVASIWSALRAPYDTEALIRRSVCGGTISGTGVSASEAVCIGACAAAGLIMLSGSIFLIRMLRGGQGRAHA